MAKKQPVPIEEKIYTIPLKREWISSSRIMRTKKSVNTVRRFISRHMHTPNVNISQKLNSALWGSGAKHPLSKIRVKAVLGEDGKASVQLPEEITFEEEKKKFLEKAKKKGEEKEGPEKEQKEPEKEGGKEAETGKEDKGKEAAEGKEEEGGTERREKTEGKPEEEAKKKS